MGQAEQDARKIRRKARRQRVLTSIRHAVRTLDDDDKEALLALAKGVAERLSDGDISAEDIQVLGGLVDDLRTARANTP